MIIFLKQKIGEIMQNLTNKPIGKADSLNDKRKSLSKNMLMSVILTSSNFIFPLVTYSYVARILGPEGTGKVAFVNSILQYFSYMAVLGIPTYGLRECSKLKDDREAFSHLVQELLLLALIATMFSYIGLGCAVIFSSKLEEYKLLFAVMSIQIILNAIGVEWVYQACEEYTYITTRSLIFKIISVVLTFLLIRNRNSVLAYGFVTIFSTSSNYICNFLNIGKLVNFKKKGNYQLKHHMKPILILFSASIVITIYANFDISMLGIIGTESEVGMYHTALKIKNVLLALSTAVTSVLIPRISFYIKNKQFSEVNKMIFNSVRVSFVLSIPVSVYVFVFASDVITFLCGIQYLPAVSTLRVLIVCIIPLILTNLFGCQLLIPLGKEKQYTQSVFIGMWINLILNFLLIPSYGAFGAAMGTLVTEVWNVFWMSNGVKSYRNIILEEINYWNYIIPIVIAGIAAIVAYSLVKNMYLMIRLGITSVIFFGCFYFIQLASAEPIVSRVIVKLKKVLVCIVCR